MRKETSTSVILMRKETGILDQTQVGNDLDLSHLNYWGFNAWHLMGYELLQNIRVYFPQVLHSAIGDADILAKLGSARHSSSGMRAADSLISFVQPRLQQHGISLFVVHGPCYCLIEGGWHGFLLLGLPSPFLPNSSPCTYHTIFISYHNCIALPLFSLIKT